MNCEQFRQILDEGSLTESSPAEQAKFHAHRLQCSECALWHQLDQTWQNTLREDVADTNLDAATFTQAVLQRATPADVPAANDDVSLPMPLVQPQAEETPLTSDPPVALSFRKHWLPVSLAAAIALGLLTGWWFQLAQKPPAPLPNHTIAQLPLHRDGSGAAVASLLRTVQGRWVTQPLAMIDGMPVVRLQVDWQVMLERVPMLLPDPARLTQPDTHEEQTHDKPQTLG